MEKLGRVDFLSAMREAINRHDLLILSELLALIDNDSSLDNEIHLSTLSFRVENDFQLQLRFILAKLAATSFMEAAGDCERFSPKEVIARFHILNNICLEDPTLLAEAVAAIR